MEYFEARVVELMLPFQMKNAVLRIKEQTERNMELVGSMVKKLQTINHDAAFKDLTFAGV